MPLFDHFDLLAPIYDRAVSAHKFEKLVELAALPVSGWLLDAGGGTGRISQALIGMAGQIIVADLSMGMLHQAARNNGLQRVCSSCEALPFPSEVFERIIMVDALHHVTSQKETARQLWRLLKPGGRMVIEEPDIRAFAVKLIALVEKLALMRSHFLAPARIVALFPYPNAGVRVESNRFNVWVVVEKQKAQVLT